jgi:hypothetical protein
MEEITCKEQAHLANENVPTIVGSTTGLSMRKCQEDARHDIMTRFKTDIKYETRFIKQHGTNRDQRLHSGPDHLVPHVAARPTG